MECPGDDTRACGNHWRLAVYQLTIQFKSPQYLGCFKDESSEIRLFKGYQQNFYNSLTVQSCIDNCRSKGFQYSGLQYRYQCFCEDRKPPNASLVGDNNCLYPCSGDSSQICGGDWRYSVYWNGFKNPLRNSDNYIGCYRERNAPLQLLPLETVSFERSLTPQLCIDHCFRKGYPYSGTQISSVHFGTQQRSQCHCGDFKPSTDTRLMSRSARPAAQVIRTTSVAAIGEYLSIEQESSDTIKHMLTPDIRDATITTGEYYPNIK
ncbi:WSC domain-containing protein ARB_07870-like [Nilaparvata lugens]|uniref:WSC domain-containing protein ARB_07870-like n=1 Tax=Nilaparvata lugens TaxID=108931 RepID=UPI00193CA76D|nr:WSC domain-containing protein ARB_07870-like [Nilaparvata lugens]